MDTGNLQPRKRLRVLFLCHLSLPDSITGAERSLLELMRGLRETAVEPSAVFPAEGKSRRTCEEDGITTTVVRYPVLWLIDPLRRNPLQHAAKLVMFLVALPLSLPLYGLLRELRPDVVHVNTSVNLAAGLLARLRGFPVVWHVREVLPGGWRGRLFARIISRAADAVIAVSAEAARPFPGSVVIPNGIATIPGARRCGTPGKVTIGCIGYLSPRKGQLELVRMMADLKQRGCEPACRLAGSDTVDRAYAAEVSREIQRLGLESAIDHVGFIEDAHSLYRTIDILAFPSPAPEGFPRVVLESMARGIPVVAFDLGGVADALGDTGFRIPAGDLNAFEDAIERLAKDPELRQRAGEAEMMRATQMFALQTSCRRVRSVYETAIKGGKKD